MIVLHDIKNIFHLIIIFQCLFLSLYLVSQKKQRRQSNLILVCFLLAIAITEMGGVLVHFKELTLWAMSKAPHLFFIAFPFRFIYMPLLFLYMLSLTKKDFQFKKIYFLHFVPFFLFLGFTTAKYLVKNAYTLKEILGSDPSVFTSQDILFILLYYGQFFAYAVAAFIVLRFYRIKIKNVYSRIDHINLSWLNFVLFGFIVWKTFSLLDFLYYILIGTGYILWFLYITGEIAFLIFVSLMFFKGLKQPVIFSGHEENQIRGKYEKTALPESAKVGYKNKLIRYMETEKPYLEPSLCLSDLAEELSIPAHHLSQTLNTCINQNFFDFVNLYRIKESQRLLSNPSTGKKTVLEILYETGFNSKSAFNVAFKKYTGMTPTEFKKSQNS